MQKVFCTSTATTQILNRSSAAGRISCRSAHPSDFLRAVYPQAGRLNRGVGNLPAMTRLPAGVIHAVTRPVYLEVVVAQALASLADTDDIEVAVPGSWVVGPYQVQNGHISY